MNSFGSNLCQDFLKQFGIVAVKRTVMVEISRIFFAAETAGTWLIFCASLVFLIVPIVWIEISSVCIPPLFRSCSVRLTFVFLILQHDFSSCNLYLFRRHLRLIFRWSWGISKPQIYPIVQARGLFSLESSSVEPWDLEIGPRFWVQDSQIETLRSTYTHSLISKSWLD